MPRKSTKPDKNVYQLKREEAGLSREQASAKLEAVSEDRIERIELRGATPHPDEVLLMADGYNDPTLCNYYCAHMCPIGRQYVPEVKVGDLSQIVLEMLASLNRMNASKDHLIEISADCKIEESEMRDFEKIQAELEHISVTIEELQLWAKKQVIGK